jgi:hypothetical protein
LAEEHKQTAQLAEERRREAELLKQTQARLEEEKLDLQERQHLIREEIASAEAQLDLVKAVLLREVPDL